jgi:solute carrier family 6 amino acid transporter-like protein 5/7/9/14
VRKHQTAFTAFVCFALFIAGLPMVTQGGIYILTLFDDFAGTYALLISSITEMLVISHVYGIDNFCTDIKLMIKQDVGKFWRVCWQYISPALLSAVLIATVSTWKTSTLDEYVFPFWSNAIAAVLILSSCVCLPALAVHHVIKKGSIKAACQPTTHWGPYKSENRKNTRYEDRREFFGNSNEYKEFPQSGQKLLDSTLSFP